MSREIWGWFDAAPVATTDPETGTVHPVAIPTAEAEALGVRRRRMIVFDVEGFLEVVPADSAGVTEFARHDFCVHFHAPGSADWVLIRQRDGAMKRIRREPDPEERSAAE